jgi:iron transport multicopper oxidase
MLSFTTLAYCFVWASLTQHIVAAGSDAYDAWGNSHGGYQNGWSSRSSSTWQKATSTSKASSPVTSVTSDLTESSSVWRHASSSSVATSVPYPSTNSSASDSSASPSKTGTALTSHASSTTDKTVTYDWNVEWMIAAPDGVARPVIGVNGQWYVYHLWT